MAGARSLINPPCRTLRGLQDITRTRLLGQPPLKTAVCSPWRRAAGESSWKQPVLQLAGQPGRPHNP